MPTSSSYDLTGAYLPINGYVFWMYYIKDGKCIDIKGINLVLGACKVYGYRMGINVVRLIFPVGVVVAGLILSTGLSVSEIIIKKVI